MRNTAIIILSVLLAAAMVLGFIFYHRYTETRGILLTGEKNLSDLKEKLARLDQDNSRLRNQVQKKAECLKELEGAQVRISELKGDLHSQQTNCEKELRAKDVIASGLEERVEGSQSHIRYLEEGIARKNNDCQGLDRKLLALKGEEARAEIRMGKMKSTYEALISEQHKKLENTQSRICELKETIRALNKGLEGETRTNESLNTKLASRDATVSQLQKRLQASESHARYLEEVVEKRQQHIKRLSRQFAALKGEKVFVEGRMGHLKSTYEALISDLEQQIEKKEVTIRAFEKEISVTFVERILFESGKTSITAEGRRILRGVGEILGRVHDKQIRVIGHTDNIPILPEYRYRFPSNWALSGARAAAVVRYFQKRIGLDPSNLEAVGRAFYEPIASNDTDEGRAKNRRVEIIVAPKIE